MCELLCHRTMFVQQYNTAAFVLLQYGLILNVVESLVVEQLGEKKLQEIK